MLWTLLLYPMNPLASSVSVDGPMMLPAMKLVNATNIMANMTSFICKSPRPQMAEMNSIVMVPIIRISLIPPSTIITPPYSFIMSCTACAKPTTLREQSMALAMAKMIPIEPPNSGPSTLDLWCCRKQRLSYRFPNAV